MTASAPARVLALRALGLGDALTGIPALRGLRRAFPGARLVLAAPLGVGSWLRDLGVVDDVVPAGPDLRAVGWAGEPPIAAVNLHGRGPQSHQLLQGLAPARLVAFANTQARHEDGPPWPEDVHEVDRWCGLVRWAGGACDRVDLRLASVPVAQEGPYAVVHPGASAESRRWPAPRWAEVAHRLVRGGLAVKVTGTAAERGLCAAVAAGSVGVEDLSGALTLPQLASTVAGAHLVLCGDTGVAHLATAYAVPSVVIFGPVAPALWGPAIDPELHVALWHGDSPSRPGDPRPGDPRPGDPHGAHVDPRLDAVSVEEVCEAAWRLRAVRSA